MVSKEELGDEWKHLPVEIIHRMKDNSYIVFTNSEKDFDWEIKDNKNEGFNKKTNDKLITKLTEINTKDFNITNQNIRKQFHELLADAFCNIYECDYDNAKYSLEVAENFILKQHNETTRTWSICATVVSSILAIVIGILLLKRNSFAEDSFSKLFVYSLFGAIGVCISNFMNLNKRFMMIETGFYRVVIESIAHVLIGILLAFFALLLIKNNLILAMFNDLQNNSEILISIIFASCEGFFPSVITHFNKKTLLEEEDA